eukprot:tig00021127_g18878.t1
MKGTRGQLVVIASVNREIEVEAKGLHSTWIKFCPVHYVQKGLQEGGWWDRWVAKVDKALEEASSNARVERVIVVTVKCEAMGGAGHAHEGCKREWEWLQQVEFGTQVRRFWQAVQPLLSAIALPGIGLLLGGRAAPPVEYVVMGEREFRSKFGHWF